MDVTIFILIEVFFRYGKSLFFKCGLDIKLTHVAYSLHNSLCFSELSIYTKKLYCQYLFNDQQIKFVVRKNKCLVPPQKVYVLRTILLTLLIENDCC